jgi:hypothetical protein
MHFRSLFSSHDKDRGKPMTDKALIEAVRTLERRAEYLAQEAALIRQELNRLVAELAADSPVVARYEIEGETYEITQAEVEAARAKLVKPWPDEAVQELALVKKMSERSKNLSREEIAARMGETIEAIRAAAIADGTAIENEWEAAIDD